MIFTDGKRMASTNSISELKTIYELIIADDGLSNLLEVDTDVTDYYEIVSQSMLISVLRHGAIFTSKENIDIILKGGLPQLTPANIYFISRDDMLEIVQILQSCSPSEGKKDQVKKLEAKLSEWLERS